jgi:hypothetical protein
MKAPPTDCDRIAGDAPKGWRTPYVLAMLILGIALIACFIVWEAYCKHPMMPLRIWKNKNFSLVSIEHPEPCPARSPLTTSQINLVVTFGFMSFVTSSFWISLYMQDVLGYSALEVALHLLPQAIAGILVNVVAAMILHKVSNKLLAGIGAIAYFFAAILLALMKESNAYWPFIFPSLILSVIGADLQFNVAIVSSPAQNWTLTDDADVRNVFFASKAAISCRRHLQHG